MIIYMSDVRRSKICAKGMRAFCVKHNIDLNDFLENGIDSEKLRQTNDTMALKVIEIAEKWAEAASRQ